MHWHGHPGVVPPWCLEEFVPRGKAGTFLRRVCRLSPATRTSSSNSSGSRTSTTNSSSIDGMSTLFDSFLSTIHIDLPE